MIKRGITKEKKNFSLDIEVAREIEKEKNMSAFVNSILKDKIFLNTSESLNKVISDKKKIIIRRMVEAEMYSTFEEAVDRLLTDAIAVRKNTIENLDWVASLFNLLDQQVDINREYRKR